MTLPPGSSLTFIPHHHPGNWAGWYGNDYAVYYPVAGRLASIDASGRAGLGPLIGESRRSSSGCWRPRRTTRAGRAPRPDAGLSTGGT